MIEQAIVWGAMLGAGASLHCAGMCGPIGCALVTFVDAPQTRPAWQRLMIMQSGKVASYAMLGLIGGAMGTGVLRHLDLTPAHFVLQWLSASVVVWLGLSTAGLLPRVVGVERAFQPVAGAVARTRQFLSQGSPELDLVSGLVWGLTPCPLVYVAVFNSLLLGSAEAGLLMMLIFGLVTSIPVIASSMALIHASHRRGRRGRLPAGLATAAAGIAAFLLTTPGSPFCIT